MEDTATPQPSDTNNPDDHSSARSGAEEHSPGRSLSTYARPALIAGVVLYLNRGAAGGNDDEDYDLEDLRDQ